MDIKFNIVKVDGNYLVERVVGDRIKAGSYDTEAEALHWAKIAGYGISVKELVSGPSLLEQQALKSTGLKEENNKRTKKAFKIKDKR